MRQWIETFLGPEARLPRWWAPVVCIVLATLAVLFWRGAEQHGDTINREVTYNDQKVYMNMAASLKESGYSYFVPRMRMPFYAVYLSLFYRSGTTVSDFFPIARRANIALALGCVIAIGLVFRWWLGWGMATALALISGFTWYVEKAGYVQPEAMLVMFVGIGCAMLGELLLAPAWWKAVLAGLMLAGWHMTKASGPAILGIFMIAWTLKMIWPGDTRRRALLTSLGIMLGSFLVPTAPYLIQTTKVFGSPFYNTQSKYFVWCEGVDEKHAVQLLDVDVRPPTPEDEKSLPTAKKFMAKHSLKDVKKRFQKGYAGMMRNAEEQHTELLFAVKFCLCMLLLSIGIYPKKAWALARERVWQIAFAFGVVTAFGALFSWIQPIRVGPRMITSIHLVPLFFSLLWTREILKGEVFRIRGATLSAGRALVGLVMLPLWAVLAWSVMCYRLPWTYFGG